VCVTLHLNSACATKLQPVKASCANTSIGVKEKEEEEEDIFFES
jgi:hypothetical protein